MKWVGPFSVQAVDIDRKLVFVQDANIGAARPFNIAQVKQYHLPETLAHSFMVELNQNVRTFNSQMVNDVYATEVLDNDDPRTKTPEMSEARRTEIKNLLNRGTFKIVSRKDIPPDANVLPDRFVVAIKTGDRGETKSKARYVVGGHRDRFKHMMVHSASTLQPQSVRLLLALAAMFDFDVWTSDVKQAYLQSSQLFSREEFIENPVPEFSLEPHQCLQLLKPQYGLCESDDLWHDTMDKHHREGLGMKPLRSDSALYVL